MPAAVQIFTRTTRLPRTPAVTALSSAWIAAGEPASSAGVSNGWTMPWASIWVTVSASLIASAVAAPLTCQKLSPPIVTAASAQPTTNSSTSRLTEIGRASWAALRLRKGSATRGSRAATEPSTRPVWRPPSFRRSRDGDNRATPATISAFQQTTRRRPFAEDRRRGTGSAQSPAQVGNAAGSCRGARVGAALPNRRRHGTRRRQPMASSTDKAQVTRAGTRKIASVAHLTELLSKSTSAVVTDYRGLTVRQLEDLRGKLRAEGIDYIVVKNTLARRAAVDSGSSDFASVLTGPVGLAIGYGDLSAPARILFEHFRSTRTLPLGRCARRRAGPRCRRGSHPGRAAVARRPAQPPRRRAARAALEPGRRTRLAQLDARRDARGLPRQARRLAGITT